MTNDVPRILLLALLLPACLPSEPAGKTAALEARLTVLEGQLAETRRQQENTLSLLPSRLSDLEQRVEETEQSRNRDREENQNRQQEWLAQLQWLHRLYGALNDAVISGERAVGLSITDQSVFPILTRYGSFLLKLTGCDKVDGGAYDVHLLLTNATPFRIHRFRLHGDFGRKSPVISAGATTRQRMETLDAWELSLAKFEQTFDTLLEPGVRTPLVLRLPASRLADLEFIRLWIDVQAVTLPAPDTAATFSTFDASRPDDAIVHVLPSDAGTFYFKLLKTEPTSGGHRLTLRFGNPFGMTIDKFRLQGTLGAKPPQTPPSAPPETRERDQLQWRQSRKPFAKEIRVRVKPLQWTEIALDLPAPAAADLEHVECRLDVTELHLPSGQ